MNSVRVSQDQIRCSPLDLPLAPFASEGTFIEPAIALEPKQEMLRTMRQLFRDLNTQMVSLEELSTNRDLIPKNEPIITDDFKNEIHSICIKIQAIYNNFKETKDAFCNQFSTATDPLTRHATSLNKRFFKQLNFIYAYNDLSSRNSLSINPNCIFPNLEIKKSSLIFHPERFREELDYLPPIRANLISEPKQSCCFIL